MANINLNFNALTKLKDWWDMVKNNFSLINTQVVNHVDGTAYNHPASKISNDTIVSGSNMKEVIDNFSITGSEHDAFVTGALVDADGINYGVGGEETFLNGRLTAWEEKHNTHLADGTSHARTARFIIGTSTAGWTSADCDYLCDGTADQTEINAAITALPATGGAIVILDGTYNITAKINVTKDNVSIRGNGNATILKRMFNSSVKEGVITLTSRSGCKIANLQINGNKTSYTSSSNYGIYLLASNNNNTITCNTCNDNNIRGICLADSSNNTVTSNTCNNNNSGIYLDASSNNSTITGNTCYNNNNHGIYLDASSNNTVTSNTCNNNTYGIYLLASRNNTVTGNTCNNNNNSGIYLISPNYNNTITCNTCNDNNIRGICLADSSNNTVTSNTCIRGTGLSTDYTASQRTIQLQGAGNSYNLISNNNCMGKAVRNEGGTGNTLVNNKFDAT